MKTFAFFPHRLFPSCSTKRINLLNSASGSASELSGLTEKYHVLGTTQYLCHVTGQVYIRCQYIIPSGLGTSFCMGFANTCTDSNVISKKMLKSENTRKKAVVFETL